MSIGASCPGCAEPRHERRADATDEGSEIAQQRGRRRGAKHLRVGIPVEVFCNEARNIGTRDNASPRASGESFEIDETEPAGGQRPRIALQDAAMSRIRSVRAWKLEREQSRRHFRIEFPWLPRINKWLPVANNCST